MKKCKPSNKMDEECNKYNIQELSKNETNLKEEIQIKKDAKRKKTKIYQSTSNIMRNEGRIPLRRKAEV